MNEEKKMIVDLVNKIKYEVTEEQMAILAGNATPLSQAEFVDWHAKIDGLNLSTGGDSWFTGEMSAQLRALLHRIVGMVREIGGKAVPIGKRIIKWLFSVIERYPKTFKAAVIMAALAFLVAHIPIVHYLLLPIVQVVAVCVIGYIFISEYVEGRIGNPMIKG